RCRYPGGTSPTLRHPRHGAAHTEGVTMTESHPIPDKPALEGLESKWGAAWESRGIYAFSRENLSRECVYSVDTPPPTASGSLHIGHVFSYTHTDIAARYQRMRGKNV